MGGQLLQGQISRMLPEKIDKLKRPGRDVTNKSNESHLVHVEAKQRKKQGH